VSDRINGALFGLGAAVLFGLSTPAAKLLLGTVSAQMLAGLFYLGAALALWSWRAIGPRGTEAPIRRGDGPMLAIVVLLGGVVGPVAMLLGLERVGAATGSLLLNLEAPFTILIAVLFFREHLGRYAALAVVLILGGAAVLEIAPGETRADIGGMLLIAAACAGWAIDNNLTQRLTLRDPIAIVRVKTLAAGSTNFVMALVIERELPPLAMIAIALAIGTLGYGVSVVLDAYALRRVGAVREAAYFATAPFVGALAALALPGESLGAAELGAMVLMALGVALLLREKHAHVHVHEAMEHEHAHVHDEHHRHSHAPDDPPGEPHSHLHRHAPIEHEHPHLPDVHHRHRH
jgi:drug/metabolite transporter (DMT)-like permease